MISNSRVLITGGSGFIGASLAHVLLEAGNSVDILDCPPSICGAGLSLNLMRFPKVKYFSGDVQKIEAFTQLPGNYDYIVHAAAVLGIKRVCTEPIHTLQVNIQGTANCLEYCLTLTNLARVLVFSTSEVYGKDAPSSEESQDLIVAADGMRWCYATSKIAAEQLTHAYAAQHGLDTVIVRPFNVYGPHRSGSNAVSTILNNLLMDRPVVLSGMGKQSRAWCYIDDFVDGLIKCLSSPKAKNGTFNIGNPAEVYSIEALAIKARELVGSVTPIFSSGSTEPDVMERSPDIHRARSFLGYKPVVSLHEGLEKTLFWMQQKFKSEFSQAA